jgi:hypothetical protein
MIFSSADAVTGAETGIVSSKGISSIKWMPYLVLIQNHIFCQVCLVNLNFGRILA